MQCVLILDKGRSDGPHLQHHFGKPRWESLVPVIFTLATSSNMYAEVTQSNGRITFSHSSNHSTLSDDSIYSYSSSFDMPSTSGSRPPVPGLRVPTGPGPVSEASASDIVIGLHDSCNDGILESAPLESAPFDSGNSAIHQYVSNTPMARRITTFRQYLFPSVPKKNISSKTMAMYLAIERNHVEPIQILTLPNVIFPDSLLPFVVDAALLGKLQDFWDPTQQTLKPPTTYTEASVKRWLNRIGRSMAKATGARRSKRQWTTQFTNSPIPGSELDRKPDIALVQQDQDFETWKNIYAVTEVTSQSTWHSDLKWQINNKTYLMLSDQHHRRFVPFLAICAEKTYFVVTDREGQAFMEINHLQAGEYFALALLRVIAGFTFASNEALGFDPSFHHLETKGSRSMAISAGGRIYAVKSLVHAVRGMVGRSTRVWSAYDTNDPKRELCIIKDGWIQEGRAEAEKENLKKLENVTGIPELIWGGTVQVSDPTSNEGKGFRDDNTRWMRLGFSGGQQYRIHRRLVLKPVGENLSTFTSLGELIAAFRDVAVGMSMTFLIYYMLSVRFHST